MRRFAIVVAALVATVLGGLVVAAPAQAGPRAERYVAITSRGDQLQYWYWIDELEGIIGCPKCMHLIDVKGMQVINPEQDAALKGGIMAGLGGLSQASIAGDERTRARLRDDALAQFTAAARALDGVGVATGTVGYYDPDKGAVVATDTAWLAAADQDIADGIALLQRAADDPSPQPWFEAAVAQLDEAFAEISGKKAIGA